MPLSLVVQDNGRIADGGFESLEADGQHGQISEILHPHIS